MRYVNDLMRLVALYKERLPEDVGNDLFDYLNNNEYGLAIEEFCNYIYEYGVSISEVDYNLVCRIARAMGMKKDRFDFLREIITPSL